jgi:signal peptidase
MTAVCVAVLVASAGGPRLGLFRVETVLSGSMRPTFAPGDVVVVRPEPLSAVRVGQVISYRIPVGDHHVESHRVVRVVRGGASPIVVTRGDANAAADPWRAQLHGTTAWRVTHVLPKLGYAVIWLRSRTVHTVTVILIPALLAALALASIWRPAQARPTA